MNARLVRSGIRWLCEDGHLCRPGEAIAFCNIGLQQPGGTRGPVPFADETRDLQAVLSTPVGGRLRQSQHVNFGGFQAFQWTNTWVPGHIIGSIELADDRVTSGVQRDLQFSMAAGRLWTNLADNRSTLLSGWFDRSRVCKAGGSGKIGTLLSLGHCEMLAIRGERHAFLEMLEAIKGPAQIVTVTDSSLVHNSRIIAELVRRTPSEREAIADDFSRTLPASGKSLTASDLIFAGAVLGALSKAPTEDEYDVLTRGGLVRSGPADAVILSLGSENSIVYQHRRLGYTIDIHPFRLAQAGPAFRAWFGSTFEPVRRTIADIRADLCALIDLVRSRRPATQFVISNLTSTSGLDDIQNYASFDAPIGGTVASVNAKDLNLMLCDLARAPGIAILDTDAIGAELGSGNNIPDGVHQSGIMQAEIRAELLRILRARHVPGFEDANDSGFNKPRTQRPGGAGPLPPPTAVQPHHR